MSYLSDPDPAHAINVALADRDVDIDGDIAKGAFFLRGLVRNTFGERWPAAQSLLRDSLRDISSQ